MPTLAVSKSYLFKLLGKEYTRDEFDDLCFEFGIELDEVTSQQKMFLAENRSKLEDPKLKSELMEKLKTLSDDELYKIDTPANRYDLLCAEGMAIALRVFAGSMPFPKFKMLPAKHTLTVKSSTFGIRDYVVCAILRGVTFTQESYQSFIDYQDKLHSGLARKRTLASVGTHDLSKISPDFTFECTPKKDVVFSPLNQNGRVLDCAGDGLTQFYANDKHIGKFVPLISNLENYPVIYDSKRTILSMPPIINSDVSKIDLSTKDVFIECTATDHHRAHVFVNQMVAAFSWYCAQEFSVETVNVKYEKPDALSKAVAFKNKAARTEDDGTITLTEEDDKPAPIVEQEVTPSMATRDMTVNVDRVNSRVGIDIDAQRCATLLNRMLLETTVLDANTVRVAIPASRSDILHSCDLVEDVAIAYGYDNIAQLPAPTKSSAARPQQPMNKLAHLIRLEVAAAGYTEMLTFSLCSRDEAFKNLNRVDKDTAVHIGNPQTFEFQVCRPSLMPGTMKVFQANKSSPLPIKLFEISDVVLADETSRTGARNERHFAAFHAQTDSSSMEDIQGLAEYVMVKMGVQKKQHFQTVDALALEGSKMCYQLEGSDDDKAFFPGRQMKIVLWEMQVNQETKAVSKQSRDVGVLGVVHPSCLKAIDMMVPCSYVEINMEPFINVGF